MTEQLTIAIAGGGIGGLSASIALREQGFDTEVYEAKPDFGELGVAVVLGPNGVKALDVLGRGIGAEVRRTGYILPPDHPLPVTAPNGQQVTTMDYGDLEGDYGAPQVTIRRADLHRILLEAHTDSGLHAGARLQGWREDGSGVELDFAGGARHRGDLLIAADGINSTVRASLHGRSEARYSGFSSLRGITYDTDLPPELAHGIWVVTPETVFMCSTIGPRQLYWSAIISVPPGTWPVDADEARRTLLERCAGWHRLPELIEAADPDSLVARELRDRPPLTEWGEGRVTLLGDAAHAMTNFWGQGANTALEDGVVLARCLRAAAGDPVAGLRAYERERIPRVNRIVDASFAAERDAEGRPWREFVDWLYGYEPAGAEVG